MSLAKALYLIDIADEFDFVFEVIALMTIIGLIISIVGSISYYISYINYEGEADERTYIIFKKTSLILVVVLLVSGIFQAIIPSQKTMYAMLIADNYTEIKGEVKDNIDYIFSKVDELIKEKDTE